MLKVLTVALCLVIIPQTVWGQTLEVAFGGGAYQILNKNENDEKIRNGLLEFHGAYFPTQIHRFEVRLGLGSIESHSFSRFLVSYSLFPTGSNGTKPYFGFGFGVQSTGMVDDDGTRNLISSHLGLRHMLSKSGALFFEARSNWVFDTKRDGEQFFTTWIHVIGGFSINIPL